MINRRVAGHEIQQEVHASFVDRFTEMFEIFIGPVARGNGIIVPYIIAGVEKRGIKTGIHPDCVHTQFLQVGELLFNSTEVSDAVSVAVTKRLRINLIENRIPEPAGHGVSSPLLSVRSYFSTDRNTSLSAENRISSAEKGA